MPISVVQGLTGGTWLKYPRFRDPLAGWKSVVVIRRPPIVLKWELRGERVRLEHDALVVTAPEEILIIKWRTRWQPEECLSLDKGTHGKHWRIRDAAEQVGNSFESTRERDLAR
jgi:hypothetical protein